MQPKAITRDNRITMPVGVVEAAPTLWLNPLYSPDALPREPALDGAAAARLVRRYSPTLALVFGQDVTPGGRMHSRMFPLREVMQGLTAPQDACFVKADYLLPIFGAIEMRAALIAVIVHVDRVLGGAGIDGPDESAPLDLSPDGAPARALRGAPVAVASTGNLGLAVAAIARAFGLPCQVHVNEDARSWKCDLLRGLGASLRIHAEDIQTVQDDLRQSPGGSTLIDDEDSEYLVTGYGMGADEVALDLERMGRRVDAGQPLIVWIPTGSGCAASGLVPAFKRLWGAHVHCFLVEPVAAPTCLLQLANPGLRPSVYDAGLDNHTQAESLAAKRSTRLLVRNAGKLISGVATVRDRRLVDWAARARASGLPVEAAACAGLVAMGLLRASAPGHAYLARTGLTDRLDHVTELVWMSAGNTPRPPA